RGARRGDRCRVSHRARRCFPRGAPAHVRLQLRRRTEDRAGQFLRLRLRADRTAGSTQARRARRLDAGAQVRAPGLVRGSVPRHAGLRPRGAAGGFSARRAGGRGGVRLDHRGLSHAASRGRPARHPDRSFRANEMGRRSMSAISATAKLSEPAAARDVDPIVLQIVEGTLNSIEAEIEYAIERTARSPMIREAHDYRVGLFDRHCRKLTGRSYSAMPNAVVRDFPLETMRPGDVFLMNDTYLTEGSIGHLPDLCSTVPVFHDGEVVAFIQAFGHHDDIGGRVPGSMPGT